MIGGCNLKQAAKKLALSCISVSYRKEENQDTELPTGAKNSGGQRLENHAEGSVDGCLQEEEGSGSLKNCAICLEPLLSEQQAIFTAQCFHAFHFLCISSSVQHGNTTCPICRAQWSYLPRQLGPKFPLPIHENDPIIRILDDSIATFRVHRRSSHRSARYDDDDPVEPDPVSDHPRLNLNLIPVSSQPLPPAPEFSPRRDIPLFPLCDGTNNPHCLRMLPVEELTPHQPATPVFGTLPSGLKSYQYASNAYLSVRLTVAPGMDMVVVASSNGAQLRLLKQSMALVVCSLRPVDRLAIVSCSSTATRAFPLRCMSSQGKRAAAQVIDRLFCVGDADQTEGLRKGVKILEDRAHHNQHACIVLLSDGPSDAFSVLEMQFQVPILHFNFRFGFGYNSMDTCIKHEFEEFLAGLLGEVIRETQLRIGENGMMVWLGELRGGEERRILVDVGECGLLSVGYSYMEGVEGEDCFRTGEVMVRVGETSEPNFSRRDMSIGGRWNSVDRWDYHDPCMARRWAKRLHGLL